MRGLIRPRVFISIASLLVIIAAVVGAAAVVSKTQAAPVTYKARPISVNPVREPATKGSDALFNCQTNRGPGRLVCYSPQQLRKAYNIDPLLNAGITGKGRTIVIIDAYQNPAMLQDLAAFDTTFGLPAANFQQIAPDGLTPFVATDPNQVGWAGEITLDVQWSHAIAPDAKIELVLAKSNQDADILSVTKYAVDHNLGDVISQSFGENENCVDPKLLKSEHAIFAEATRKNITILASSGDQGAAQQTCDGNSWVQVASSPASDPLVTGVGATELVAAPECNAAFPCPAGSPAPGTYQSESALNEPPHLYTAGSFSTGGGFSNLYRRPEYQEGIPNVQGNHRGVPDVAYNGAIGHGVLASFTVGGGFSVFGGTSAGSPQWAGLVALGDQLAGRRLGFINTSLYRIGKIPTLYNAAFHDIITGNNSVQEPDATNTLVAIPGYLALKNWDATTGLGTPKADALVPFLVVLNYFHDGNDAINHSANN